MKKRKCDWCYFNDESKKKITNWFRAGDDFLFLVDDKLYMYKKYRFGYEEPYIEAKYRWILPFSPTSGFYIHRFFIKDYLLSCIDKNDDNQWFTTNIKRIELRSENTI